MGSTVRRVAPSMISCSLSCSFSTSLCFQFGLLGVAALLVSGDAGTVVLSREGTGSVVPSRGDTGSVTPSLGGSLLFGLGELSSSSLLRLRGERRESRGERREDDLRRSRNADAGCGSLGLGIGTGWRDEDTRRVCIVIPHACTPPVCSLASFVLVLCEVVGPNHLSSAWVYSV